MEREFSEQKLLLREAKADKGINLLIALLISLSFLRKPLY